MGRSILQSHQHQQGVHIQGEYTPVHSILAGARSEHVAHPNSDQPGWILYARLVSLNIKSQHMIPICLELQREQAKLGLGRHLWVTKCVNVNCASTVDLSLATATKGMSRGGPMLDTASGWTIKLTDRWRMKTGFPRHLTVTLLPSSMLEISTSVDARARTS